MGYSDAYDRWTGRIATAWTFLGPIVPGTAAAIVIGAAATSVSWISNFGFLGISCAALLAFFLGSASFALIGRGKLWRAIAAKKARLSQHSSPFDPMETIFQNKRIMVTDLVNPYDQIVLGKKFINCEIIGPANLLVIFSNAKFMRNNFADSDAVEIRDNAIPQNAIAFANCDFEGCRFFKVSMLFQSSSRKAADQLISNLNWLTEVEEPMLALTDETPEGKRKTFWQRLKGSSAAENA